MTDRDFAELAQPHSWYLTADNLHDMACELYARRGKETLDLRGARGQLLGRWDMVDRPVFLLAGFALENALKCLMVQANPQLVANGKLHANIKSHKLTKLCDRTTLAPYKRDARPTLARFENGLASWARYPTGSSKKETPAVGILDPGLWSRYLRYMAAYGRRIKRELRKPWHGPAGYTTKAAHLPERPLGPDRYFRRLNADALAHDSVNE